MMKLLRPVDYILLLFLFFTNIKAEGQGITKNEISAKLEKYCINIPYEEAYLHSDRQDYIAGEDVWFSIYIVDKQSRQLSGRSKIAYFELLNSENKPVIQKRLLLENGLCSGQALLPDTLSSGIYTIRVYTNMMKNFLPGNSFMKNINVYNTFQKKGFKKKIIYEKDYPGKQNIEFFPEGGTLLSGTDNKVAVRVFNELGKGLLISGIVKNDKGDSITSFKTDKYGTGSLKIKPEKGRRYFVRAADTMFFLPEVSDNGYTLKSGFVNDDSLKIFVSAGENVIPSNDNTLMLLIHNNGITLFSEDCRLTGRLSKITIPRIKLKPGINHIALFNKGGTPLSERLIYINDSHMKDSALLAHQTFKKREKVVLEFEMMPVKQNNQVNLSASASPKPVGNYTPEIEDYLIFGTEFGPLPWSDAGEKTSDVDIETIDNFLLSTHSRWISWDNILMSNVPAPAFRTEETGHFLSGFLKNRNTQSPESGKYLFLSIPGKIPSFQYAKTDSTGHFDFVLPVDNTRRDLIFQPQIPDNGNTINIESSFSWKLPMSKSYYESVSSELPVAIKDFSINYQINKIYSTSYKKDQEVTEVNQPSSERRFYGKPEIELVLADYIKLPVMQEIFFELIPGVKLRSKKAGYELKVMNPYSNIFYEEPPLVMIDGVCITDLTVLANLDPETVEKIDIVKTTYLIGDLRLYGIVNVITWAGNFKGLTLPDYAAKLSYRVIDRCASFYSPDYSEPEKRLSRIPDLRNTLYWNPSVKPDKDGKVRIEFWTSDIASEYLINVQGIGTSGEPVSYKQLIKVE